VSIVVLSPTPRYPTKQRRVALNTSFASFFFVHQAFTMFILDYVIAGRSFSRASERYLRPHSRAQSCSACLWARRSARFQQRSWGHCFHSRGYKQPPSSPYCTVTDATLGRERSWTYFGEYSWHTEYETPEKFQPRLAPALCQAAVLLMILLCLRCQCVPLNLQAHSSLQYSAILYCVD